MRALVDGPCHEAWARLAVDLLPVDDQPEAGAMGASWQAAIRSVSTSKSLNHKGCGCVCPFMNMAIALQGCLSLINLAMYSCSLREILGGYQSLSDKLKVTEPFQ